MVCSYQAVFFNKRLIVNYGFLLIHRSTKTHQFTSIKPADAMHVNNMNILEINTIAQSIKVVGEALT